MKDAINMDKCPICGTSLRNVLALDQPVTDLRSDLAARVTNTNANVIGIAQRLEEMATAATVLQNDSAITFNADAAKAMAGLLRTYVIMVTDAVGAIDPLVQKIAMAEASAKIARSQAASILERFEGLSLIGLLMYWLNTHRVIRAAKRKDQTP